MDHNGQCSYFPLTSFSIVHCSEKWGSPFFSLTAPIAVGGGGMEKSFLLVQITRNWGEKNLIKDFYSVIFSTKSKVLDKIVKKKEEKRI